MRKKIILIASAVFLCLVVAVGGTMASYNAENNDSTNILTIGGVSVSLTQTTATDVVSMPGETFRKDITVTNDGKMDTFLRLYITYTIDGKVVNGKDPYIEVFQKTFQYKGKDGINPEFIYCPEDEYYYYVGNRSSFEDGILPAGAVTALFDTVGIPAAWDNQIIKSMGTGLDFTVSAEVVQAANMTQQRMLGVWPNYPLTGNEENPA